MAAQKAQADVILHRLHYALPGWDVAVVRRFHVRAGNDLLLNDINVTDNVDFGPFLADEHIGGASGRFCIP
jgi:hypothetical protein